MEQDLITFFTTKAQANEFSTRLTAIQEQLYETHFSLEKAAVQHLGIQKSDKFLKLLRENHVTEDSPTAIKTFLTKIQTTMRALPMIDITLAFEPTESTLGALSDWFIINFKKQFLFDLTIDHRLIAGAIIKYNGMFIDCSSKPIFEKIVQEEAQKQMQPAASASPLVGKHLIDHFHLGR